MVFFFSKENDHAAISTKRRARLAQFIRAAKAKWTRYLTRQEKRLPLLNQLHAWLMKSVQQVLPKTKLGEAIQYCLNQWEKLARYTLDGLLNIDNNRAERAIKPFVIGRKNWLFSQTATGANASAVLYSIIETAKANDLNVFEYVMSCLDELSKPDNDIEQLLP